MQLPSEPFALPPLLSAPSNPIPLTVMSLATPTPFKSELHDAKEMLYRCILSSDSNPMSCDQKEHRFDAVDTYFTCLVACDLLDHDCPSHCVEELREAS